MKYLLFLNLLNLLILFFPLFIAIFFPSVGIITTLIVTSILGSIFVVMNHIKNIKDTEEIRKMNIKNIKDTEEIRKLKYHFRP